MSGRGQQHVYTRSQVVQEYHHEMKLGSDDVRKIARAAASHGQSRALSCLQYCCSSGCRHSCRVPTRARARILAAGDDAAEYRGCDETAYGELTMVRLLPRAASATTARPGQL